MRRVCAFWKSAVVVIEVITAIETAAAAAVAVVAGRRLYRGFTVWTNAGLDSQCYQSVAVGAWLFRPS